MDGITLDTIRSLHDWLDIINYQSNTAGIRNRNQSMTPYKHAQSSAQKWGGNPEDYITLHDWFDETKQYTGDWTHRALRHHSAGIQWSIEKFGHCITNSKGQKIPTKILAELYSKNDQRTTDCDSTCL